MSPTGAVKTATDRATEAAEAAERMYADEMGATLSLRPAAKVAAIRGVTDQVGAEHAAPG